MSQFHPRAIFCAINLQLRQRREPVVRLADVASHFYRYGLARDGKVYITENVTLYSRQVIEHPVGEETINMPKKFVGENSKAVAARARKAAAKEAETIKKAQEAEDREWEDNDKQVLKKKQKQEEVEKKRLQQLEKKAEAKALLERELANIKVGGKQPASKITRAEIVAVTEKRNQVAMKKKEDETPIEENLNRLILEGETAHGIDEAISVLSTKDPEVDRHPEKRMKAAYVSFEERMMPMIKEQNPTLRLSQLKQILRKEWMKSTENPLNQTLLNR